MVKTVRHVGIVVSDMERALAFYRDLLKLKVVLDAVREGPFIDKLLALSGVKMRLVMLEAPDGNRVELFEFHSHPKQPPAARDISYIGCSHVALAVQDVDEAYRVLSRHGIRFNCEPMTSPDGYAKVTYCHDPDGTVLELVQILAPDRDPYKN